MKQESRGGTARGARVGKMPHSTTESYLCIPKCPTTDPVLPPTLRYPTPKHQAPSSPTTAPSGADGSLSIEPAAGPRSASRAGEVRWSGAGSIPVSTQSSVCLKCCRLPCILQSWERWHHIQSLQSFCYGRLRSVAYPSALVCWRTMIPLHYLWPLVRQMNVALAPPRYPYSLILTPLLRATAAPSASRDLPWLPQIL